MTNLRARVLLGMIATGYNGDGRLSVNNTAAHEFEYGESGALRGDFLFDREFTLTPSQAATVNLGNGSQSTMFGTAIDATRLSAVCVRNTGTTAVALSGTCPAIGAVTIPPGACYCVSDPTDTGYSTGGESGTIVVTNQSDAAQGAFRLTAVGVNGA